jgi:hypothetical protein
MTGRKAMNVTFKSSLLSHKARLVVTEETIRHVALELVRLGREVPEASWHEGAEDYAVAMVRRLVEIARDEDFIMKHKTVVNLDGKNTEAWIQPDEYMPGWWTMVYWDWKQNITHVIFRRTEAEAKAELDEFAAKHGRWSKRKSKAMSRG